MHKKVEKKKQTSGVHFIVTAIIGFVFYLLVVPGIKEIIEKRGFVSDFENKKAKIETEIALTSPNYKEKVRKEEEKKEEDIKSFQKILPVKDQVRQLTNEIEEFVNSKNSRDVKIKLVSLSFGKPTLNKVKGYASASVSATVEANQRGLLSFMKFIENSGNLEDKDSIPHLLSLSSLKIPVTSVSNGSINKFNFNIMTYYAPESTDEEVNKES